MAFNELVKDAQARYDKALAHLGDLLKGIRTGRASPALVEHIRVDYYGAATPINQLASISIPEPRQILIKPFDPSVIKEVAKAILKSDLGANPQEDNKVLRITMPPLSGEQRQKFAAKAKELCEETRVSLRNVRRDVNKHSDGMLRDGKLTEDEHKRLQEKVQTLLKDAEHKVDEVLKKKTQEITEN
jgi:ribosome recycling factor